LVTRPAHQNAHLCALISAAGGIPVALPVLAIEEPEDIGAALALAARLDDFDIAIFVSVNAVERGLAIIEKRGGMPSHLEIAAVGQRTAEALRRRGARIDIPAPPPYNSEGLLAAAELQTVMGKRILIFRGSGGRELLADTLRQRGAAISYAEVYRRVKPDGELADTVRQAGEIDLVMVSSQDGLRNLMEMAERETCRDWLLNKQLVAISARVAQLADNLGFKHRALTAEQASDEAMVAACAAWRLGLK